MLNNASICITGGTGSFGNKFIEMIFKYYEPAKVIIYSRDEYKQFLLKNKYSKLLTPSQMNRLRFFIGDVRDRERLYRAFSGVDVVVHAAAMKQVPACEYNPFEATKTNIFGAQNVIDAAIDRQVKKVVALSTDKAVNPINLYGGTKLVSDKLFVSANAYSGENGTIFSLVRYGNVVGSRGSVIPYFKELLEKGEALTITDLRMTRFWITLEEGVFLVFKALSESKGGETYIAKIPSFKVTDLAKAMIFRGNEEAKTFTPGNPGGKSGEKLGENSEGEDISKYVKLVGIREGEKLHEIMITPDDSHNTYEYDKHFVIYPNYKWFKKSSAEGKRVKEGFEYSSATNPDWLSVQDIRRLIKNGVY